MRLQSPRIKNKGMKKDAKDKRPFTPALFPSEKPIQFAQNTDIFSSISPNAARSFVIIDPVANAEGIPPTFISYAHFFPNGILRETVAETELETFGTALESLMYCFTPHEGASACPSLGNSPLTAS